jgi:hypothetical protein
MSFANLKKSSKTNLKQLAEKMTQETSGGDNYVDNRFWNPDIDRARKWLCSHSFSPSA